jgi:tellurite resistance protein TehA-like permease
MSAASRAIAGLHPAYFAMVMATGIVSIACHFTGLEWVADGLFWLNLGLYPTLWLLYVIRLIQAPERFLADVNDHNRGVGFFTIVAGTCVLGSQFVLLRGDQRAATLLWLLGIALWLVVMYGVFTCLTVKARKPPLEEALNGGWLLAVVATQSASVLGNLVAPSFTVHREEVLFIALVTWLGGGMLYVWIISLIFYRCMFLPLDPAHLTPPYWINMGAMAISTLAGVGLVSSTPHSALLRELLPFLKGLTLLFWATATMWIPMLLILGIWRHIVRRYPLAYDASYWGVVFPLGMYTACTYRLAVAMHMPFLLPIPRGCVYVALLAWVLTSTGLVAQLWKGSRSPGPERSEPVAWPFAGVSHCDPGVASADGIDIVGTAGE